MLVRCLKKQDPESEANLFLAQKASAEAEVLVMEAKDPKPNPNPNPNHLIIGPCDGG